MLLGSYCIANDLLGVIVGGDDWHWHIKDEEGKVRKVDKLHVHDIASPQAVATLMENKVREKVR